MYKAYQAHKIKRMVLLMETFAAICIILISYIVYQTTRNEIDRANSRLEVTNLEHERNTVRAERDKYKMYSEGLYALLSDAQGEIDGYQNVQRRIPEIFNDISRGASTRRTTMVVTAYDLSYASCQKHPWDNGYGITASGNPVQDMYTIAADPSIPFGTRVFIPQFKDEPNYGIFVVEDRGSDIHGDRIDIFMSDGAKAAEFGKQTLDVYIITGG